MKTSSEATSASKNKKHLLSQEVLGLEKESLNQRPKKKKRSNIQFHQGDQVSHPKFGQGVITHISGDVVSVDFGEEHGTKRIKANFLEGISS